MDLVERLLEAGILVTEFKFQRSTTIKHVCNSNLLLDCKTVYVSVTRHPKSLLQMETNQTSLSGILL